MCGIAGIVLNSNRPLPNLEQRLAAMAAAMAHRGPDDSGLYIAPDGRTGLVNCRLAIRDCSPAGHMPMGSADAATWITYNGETYNADTLRADLERTGVRFRSNSDTECLLHGYRTWGEDMLGRLRGMYAFAIYDGSPGPQGRERLLLARDQLGIKPLYYAHTAEGFCFASELKALLASGLVSRTLDPAAIVSYLLLGSIPSPLTIYRDVRCLQPGSVLELELDDGPLVVAPRRYWQMPCDTDAHVNEAETVAHVRNLLHEAVRSQMVSDVPLGAFLSGGLDSSAIVALMRAATDGPIRTCSMVFEEHGYSESSYAQAMAQAVSSEHYERAITSQDVLGELDQIMWAMDQPTIDGVNTYFVAQTAREAGLTVALSGLGGDEIFGGYRSTFDGVPRLLRAVTLAQRVPGGAAFATAAAATLPLQQRWSKVAAAVGRPASLASAYLAMRGLFSPREVRALVGDDVWHAAQRFDLVAHIAECAGDGAGDTSPFAWVSRAELSTYTQHQLLRDTDAMSMAHSLEVRVPLLDHKLVEAVLRLPAALKQGDGPKPLLVRAIGDLLPATVRERREKRGFTLPFDRWLRGPLRPRLHEWQSAAPGLLHNGSVAAAQHQFDAGRLHWSRLWALVVLQGWSAQVT